MQHFDLYLIKPTRYDDEGYPLQWWRSFIPSNSLACLLGISNDAIERQVLGADISITVHAIDETNTSVSPAKIIKDIAHRESSALICLVGVQTNQFPRAMDMAVEFRQAGVQVCIGGFHVSGCISMLKELPDDIKAIQEIGVSIFAGEAEDLRFDEVLLDAQANALKPLYNHVRNTPNIGGAPLPVLPPEQVAKNLNKYSSFDLGRGCPFECSFCTIINVQGRKSRYRTPDDLEKIIRDNAKLGINRFFLTDDNFARNKAWRSFTERLIELRKEGLKIRFAIQVDTMAHKIDGFIEQCVQAGADQIFIGLENINSDSLELVKKRQNRIEDYRAMFMAWKRYPVFITCGYIIGFPNDTPETIARDIEVIKAELPIDTIYLNYLTPLPGSEDHKKLLEAGIWMDPDMSKYDLSHRVTHHPRMSDAEWEAAYDAAHASFYSWDHMNTIIKRVIALKSNKKITTVNRLLVFRESVKLEQITSVESGYLRVRRRLQRKRGMPIENPVVFYTRNGWRMISVTAQLCWSYGRLRLMLWRAMRDPRRLEYTDHAIAKADPMMEDALLQSARITDYAQRRIDAHLPAA